LNVLKKNFKKFSRNHFSPQKGKNQNRYFSLFMEIKDNKIVFVFSKFRPEKDFVKNFLEV